MGEDYCSWIASLKCEFVEKVGRVGLWVGCVDVGEVFAGGTCWGGDGCL